MHACAVYTCRCVCHTHTQSTNRVYACMRVSSFMHACAYLHMYAHAKHRVTEAVVRAHACHSCTHIYMYTHSHVHTFTCTHIHLYTQSPVHTFTCTRMHMYTHAHVHAFTCAFCRHASLRLADPISPPRLPSLPPGYAYEQESPLALTSLKHMLLCKVVCVCVCVCMCMCVQGYLSV